jgi:tetratricopeptide (TPR) repeat protein
MMKLFKLVPVALFALTINLSCKKYLDENPTKGQIIPDNVLQFRGLLNYYYNANYTEHTIAMMTDDIVLDPSITSYDGNVLASYQFKTNSFWAKDIWINGYKRINTFNSIIDYVINAQGATADKEQVKAIASVLRGFEYYALVNVFSRPYKAGSANDWAGVPLVLHADINSRVGSRETVKKVYDQILTDILGNIDKLPLSTNTIYEINQQGALGMLARIYLQMQDYTNARIMAERALAISKPVFDYKTILFSTPGNYYGGFSNLPSIATWPEAIYYRQYQTPYILGGSNYYMSADLDGLYKTGDLRRTIHFYNKRTTGENYPAGWYFGPGLIVQANNFRNLGISTPELQLIIAEAAARNGGTPDLQVALNQLNSLRKLRFKADAYADLLSSDATEVLQWVLDERRRELFFTPTRFFDLKRLNLDPVFRKTIVHKFGNQTYTLEAVSPLYQPLIPQEALYNSDIIQNQQ